MTEKTLIRQRLSVSSPVLEEESVMMLYYPVLVAPVTRGTSVCSLNGLAPESQATNLGTPTHRNTRALPESLENPCYA